MLIDIGKETKAMIDGKNGFNLANEYRQSLTNEINRIFRSYVMVFGLESVSL